MNIVVETQRTVVRAIEASDLQSYFAVESDDKAKKFLGGPLRKSNEEIRHNFPPRHWKLYDVMAVIERNSGSYMGRCSLKEDSENRELEIVLGSLWQGQGYGHEVCKALIFFAVNNLSAAGVNAKVHPENEASIRLLRKLGMEKIRTSSDTGIYKGFEIFYAAANVFRSGVLTNHRSDF